MVSLFVLLPLAFTTSLVHSLASSGFLAHKPAPSGPCASFPDGRQNVGDFTLAALDRTFTNVNSTGAPLVLGQAGAIDGAEFEVLSTWSSFPYNQWPSLTLKSGGLIAHSDSFDSQVVTVSGGAANGSEITFVTTSLNPPAPNPVFCVVADPPTSRGREMGFPQLAVNGRTDLFSLCMTGTFNGASNNVVYNATADNLGSYLFNTCYAVTLQLILNRGEWRTAE